jgi:hypothetical protein
MGKKNKAATVLKNFYSDAKDAAIVQTYGLRNMVTLGNAKATNKEIKAMNDIELKILRGNKNFKKK